MRGRGRGRGRERGKEREKEREREGERERERERGREREGERERKSQVIFQVKLIDVYMYIMYLHHSQWSSQFICQLRHSISLEYSRV